MDTVYGYIKKRYIMEMSRIVNKFNLDSIYNSYIYACYWYILVGLRELLTHPVGIPQPQK
jgi:hypothetical protein